MTKIRYKLIIPIFLILGITCLSSNVMAHPAAAMHMEYDEDTTTLSIYIVHGVTDPNYHFAETIVVRVNGTIKTTKQYFTQDEKHIHHYLINVLAHNHDIINVTAICSLGGEYTKEIIVGHVEHEHKGSFSSAAAPTIVASILTVCIFAIPYALDRKNPDKSKTKRKDKRMKSEK